MSPGGPGLLRFCLGACYADGHAQLAHTSALRPPLLVFIDEASVRGERLGLFRGCGLVLGSIGWGGIR